MVNGLKTLLIFLGLTTAALAQDVKLAYIKYFSGEITANIYSYNYLESYNDQNYMSSLIAKDISSIIIEEPSLEYGPIVDVILQHDKESGWTKDLGFGVYAQFPTPDFMYGELYFEPYWMGSDAKVIGTSIGIYPKDNISITGSLEYCIETYDGKKSSGGKDFKRSQKGFGSGNVQRSN